MMQEQHLIMFANVHVLQVTIKRTVFVCTGLHAYCIVINTFCDNILTKIMFP